jgi:hypothetical protein
VRYRLSGVRASVTVSRLAPVQATATAISTVHGQGRWWFRRLRPRVARRSRNTMWLRYTPNELSEVVRTSWDGQPSRSRVRFAH